jgi:hypothetical protein
MLNPDFFRLLKGVSLFSPSREANKSMLFTHTFARSWRGLITEHFITPLIYKIFLDLAFLNTKQERKLAKISACVPCFSHISIGFLLEVTGPYRSETAAQMLPSVYIIFQRRQAGGFAISRLCFQSHIFCLKPFDV